MPSWNVKLGIRESVVRIEEILNRKPDFIVVRLSNGKQQKLCDANFPEWREIEEGRKIELTIQEAVTRAKALPVEFEKRVQEFLNDLQKRISGLFFMWVCEYCKTMGYVTYEEGDNIQGIAERIVAGHKEKAKPDCNKAKIQITRIRIYDHRGLPQKDSALIISLVTK